MARERSTAKDDFDPSFLVALAAYEVGLFCYDAALVQRRQQ
jgi:hypothetical protein